MYFTGFFWPRLRDDVDEGTRRSHRADKGIRSISRGWTAGNCAGFACTEQSRAGPNRNPVSTALPTPAEPSVVLEPVVERPPVRPLEALPARVLPQSEARKEIQNRIAAFQAHQHRFHREREAYFKSVLIKVRSAIENGPDTPSA